MIKRTIFIPILLWLVLPLSGYSQGVFINSTPYTSDIQMFMLSDFNFTGKGQSSFEIFEINISNLSDQPVRCVLKMQVQAQTLGPMAAGETDPFELAAGQNIRITNRNLFSAAQQFSLQDYEITSAGGDLSSQLLSTGRLPADTYFFVFNLLNADNGTEFGQTIVRFNLTNPRLIELISPGDSGNSSELPQVFSIYPLFRWESDMSAFKLIIAEKLPDAQDDLSPEEILQQRIIFKRTLRIDGSRPGMFAEAETVPTTMYQYPIAGARMLEEGKTYYWQVIGLVATSGAPEEIASEIYKFQIAGAGGAALLTPLQQQILNLVSELDPELLKPGGELNGFIPTESVKKNGVDIGDKEIVDILSKLVNRDFDALDVAVE